MILDPYFSVQPIVFIKFKQNLSQKSQITLNRKAATGEKAQHT